MGKKVSREQATLILADVPAEKIFWCFNNMQFRNLEELSKALPKIKGENYTHHVNKEKNDFANWIYDVIGDVWLATTLRKSTKKTDITKKIRERVKELRQQAR